MRKILFDVDGTLVNSAAVVERVWRLVADQHGADAQAILGNCHGRLDTDVVRQYFRPEVAQAVLEQVASMETEAVDGVVAMPGAQALLAGLSPGDWAAVTSGSRQLMTARLRAAGLPVPAVFITADDVSRVAAYVECVGAPGDEELAEELRAWCKGRLRRYEYPHIVTFVDDLPRTLTGKVQRFRLREWAQTEAASPDAPVTAAEIRATTL